MTPTRGQVKARFLNILDDPLGLVFDETVFAPAFAEAYDAMFTAFLQYQVSNIEILIPWTLPAGTTALKPADMGVLDFGEFIYLLERTAGSSDRYKELAPVDRLPQREQGQSLGEFNYIGDTFNFIGATGNIDLLVRYSGSGTAPTNDNAVIGVDSSQTFLSHYAVSVAGPRKGYVEVGASSRLTAVGPAYDAGKLGGELFRMVQTRVRTRQKVPIVPKRFSAGQRLGGRRAIPYATLAGDDMPAGGYGYGVGPLGVNPLGQ